MKPNCCIERLRTITQEVSLFSIKKRGRRKNIKSETTVLNETDPKVWHKSGTRIVSISANPIPQTYL